MGQKKYVVYEGREPGVYDTWGEASSEVNGYKGAVHQSFKSGEEGKKTYVVYEGREPGVYGTWREASSEVIGHKGAVHQSFKSAEEAKTTFHGYMEKQSAATSFTSSGSKSSCASSSSKR